MDAGTEAGGVPSWRDVWRSLAPFARRHRRLQAAGWALTLLGVASQLALPWPLKQLLALWSGPGEAAAWTATLPDAVSASALLVAGFLLLIFAAGYFDHAQRLWFTRFAIAWARDVRAAATEAALELPRRSRAGASGDLVARLISDVARFKAGIKIFLIYVATNLCLLLGATVLVSILSPALGAIFGGATLLAALVATWGSRVTRRIYHEYRHHEGLLASTMEDDADDDELDDLGRASGRFEAAEMRQQGRATWAAHGLMGLAIVLGVLIGVRQVAAGRMEPATLMIFLAYAFLLAKPLVRLTRQATRSGRLLAVGERLGAVLAGAREARQLAREMPALAETAAWVGASQVGRLDVGRGERLGLLGEPVAGGEELLDLMAGRASHGDRQATWDGHPLDEFADEDVGRRIAALSADPGWKRRPLRDVLDSTGVDEARAMLAELGLSPLIASLPEGLDAAIGSDELAPGEARLLWLARMLLGRADLLLLHDPTAGLTPRHAEQVTEALARRTRGRTVVCCAAERALLSWCDRIEVLATGPAGR
jgi:ABC-type multidrug transport system fused ATPase/permease subunit